MTAFEYLEQSGYGITDAQAKNMADGTTMISVLSRLRKLARENDTLDYDSFVKAATQEHAKVVEATKGNTLELAGFLEVCEGIWADAH